MDLVVGVLSHTPLWAYTLFALLILLGLQARRPRTVTLRRLLVVPIVFIVWGLSSLVLGPAPTTILLLARALAAAIAFAFGWFMPPMRRMTIDPASNLVHVPGSPIPLFRNVAIFLTKYVLIVAIVITEGDPTLRLADATISGAISGYFLSSLIWVILKARTAA